MRIMDLADELGVSTVTVVTMCHALGIAGHSAGSELTEPDVERLRSAPIPAEPPPLPPAPPVDPWAASGLAPPIARVEVHAARRRRDPLVSGAWSQWWRAIGVFAVITLVYLYIAYRFARVSMFDDHSSLDLPTTAPSRLVLLTALAVPVAYATLRVFQAASNAHAAWDRIGDSPTTLTGRPSIVFLWTSAVAFALVLAGLVLGGLTWTIVGLFA